MKRGDVVLVRFPHPSGQRGKKRPALDIAFWDFVLSDVPRKHDSMQQLDVQSAQKMYPLSSPVGLSQMTASARPTSGAAASAVSS